MAANVHSTHIRLNDPETRADWTKELTEALGRARQTAQRRLGLQLRGPIDVRTFPDTLSFQAYLAARPEHVTAVARPDRREIVINRLAWVGQGPARQQQTLIHEMVHLILGQHVPGRLPAWLEEGLAMLVAGQRDFGTWRLMIAGAFNQLLPLRRLQYSVLTGGDAQHLAYAQSLSVTRYLLQRDYPEASRGGLDPSPLARELADPSRTDHVLERLWNPHFLNALEYQWRRSHNTLWRWIAVLTGGSVFWVLASGVFLLAYWRKRRFARKARERFASDELRDAELGLEPPPWEYGLNEAEAREHDPSSPK